MKILAVLSYFAMKSTFVLSNNTLKGFLRRVHNIIKESANVDVAKSAYGCLGNEAADADSIISSISYAYLKNNCNHPDLDVSSDCINYIPTASVLRSEIHLRQDVKILLNEVELELSDIVCIDEVPSDTFCHNNIHQLILLDHNSISTKTAQYFQSKLSESTFNIIEILDHHVDLNMHSECTGSSRMIEFDVTTGKPTVGSTCTLISEQYLKYHPSLLDHTIATLLMGVICLDTANMNPKIGKGTIRDEQALKVLEQISTINRNILYEKLNNAKLDIKFWQSLSASDALKLDYKCFDGPNSITYGMSSVLLPISEVLDKSDLLYEMKTYLYEYKVDSMVVMAFVHDPVTPYRQLMIVTSSKEKLDHLHDYLISNTNNLNLSPILLTGHQQEMIESWHTHNIYIKAYNQNNLSISRKQLAPLVYDYYKTSLIQSS